MMTDNFVKILSGTLFQVFTGPAEMILSIKALQCAVIHEISVFKSSKEGRHKQQPLINRQGRERKKKKRRHASFFLPLIVSSSRSRS